MKANKLSISLILLFLFMDVPTMLVGQDSLDHLIVEANGTGRSTGHIGQVVFYNPTSNLIDFRLNSFIIPSERGYQGYYSDSNLEGQLSPGDSMIFKINGYCYLPNLQPVPAGISLPEFDSWVLQDEFDYSIFKKFFEREGSVSSEITAVGAQLLIKEKFDFKSDLKQLAPLFEKVIRNTQTSYSKLNMNSKLQRIYPGKPEKEELSYLQHVFWDFTSNLMSSNIDEHRFRRMILNQSYVSSYLDSDGDLISEMGITNSEVLNWEIAKVWESVNLIAGDAGISNLTINSEETNFNYVIKLQDRAKISSIWKNIRLTGSIAKSNAKGAPILPLIFGGTGVIAGGVVIKSKGADPVLGCTDPISCNFNPDATEDDGSCLYLDCIGECGGELVVGTPCNDGNECTINDIIDANCDCNGTFEDTDGDGICDSEDFCPELDNSLIGTSCDDGDPCTTNDLFTPGCECEGTYLDSDNDGVCDADDQCEGFNDNLIGTSCDDGDDCTENDIYNADCDCEGVYTDSDNDGICDAEDTCPDLDDSLIGTSCNDGDDCTINDIWLASCDCVGTYVDSDNDGVCDADDLCPGFDDNLIGSSCDDNDECTINDVISDSCECEGTFQDSDSDGICDANDICPDLDNNLIGTSCDDGDECTINDTYTSDCECEGSYSDLDADGICDADDLCPGFNDTLIGSSCDDGIDCSINDIYTANCLCEGTIIDTDGDGFCDPEDQCPGFDDNLIGTSCDDGDDCTLNDLYNSECNCEGIYSDTDGDGICDTDDICPGFDDNLVGLNCDDGDDCTLNDIYTTDCECAGIFVDSDNDGVCDAEDQCPGSNDALIGNSCDDGDDCTVNDFFNNECNCEGEFLDSDGDGVCDFDDQCPGFDDSLIGASCDDGNDCTDFDVYLNCECVGTFQDADGDGICDVEDQCPGFDDGLIGTSCNDGDDCTINDTYQFDCNCLGIFQDSDGDGVCDAEDQCPGLDNSLIGTSCNDGDDCTANDIYTSDCNCEGTFIDSDGDGVCDAEDQCPGYDNNLIGEPCDDGNDCTINDVIGILCNCGGSLLDADIDGICDYDDICPGFDDNLIGQSCDDGNSCTYNDIYTSNCQCEGTPQTYVADIETTNTYCQLDNGTATVTMSPPGNYSFAWDFEPGTETALDLSSGSHHLQVTDLSTGCITFHSFNINQSINPDLFVVTNLIPDPGDGSGAIVIELNNIYNGPYEVCWTGQTVGGSGCEFPLNNGPFAISGVSDFYDVQVQIFNGAPVSCIHQDIIPIPGANAIQENDDIIDRLSLAYTNTVYQFHQMQSSERVILRSNQQIQTQGGIQFLYEWNIHYRIGIQLSRDLFYSVQPGSAFVGPVIKWVPWRDDLFKKKK